MNESPEEYLTVEELSQKIKFSKQTLYNLIYKKEFILKKHYLKPRPKKILFIWSAIKEWMGNPSDESTPEVISSQDDSPTTDKNLINI